jgi:hypothetical protein
MGTTQTTSTTPKKSLICGQERAMQRINICEKTDQKSAFGLGAAHTRSTGPQCCTDITETQAGCQRSAEFVSEYTEFVDLPGSIACHVHETVQYQEQ